MLAIRPLTFLPNYEQYKHLEHTSQAVFPQRVLVQFSEQNPNQELPNPTVIMIRTETRQTHVTPHFLDGIDHIYVSQQVLECLLAFEPYPEVFYQLINPVPPQATFIQLRPETMDFSQIQDNPRVVLERAFRNNYHVITTNQPLTFQHLGQIYYFQITKTKPAPCVVLTDAEPEVDFLRVLALRN